jgi:hypothetical protein
MKNNFSVDAHKQKELELKSSGDISLIKARRAAFIARFIVLREAKRSKAHRTIELLKWEETTTAEQLAGIFRDIFVQNHDNMSVVDRDIKRALSHANRSIEHFVEEYAKRASNNFIDALIDYDYSNQLLFCDGETPKMDGWRLPSELLKVRDEKQTG